MAKIHRRTLIAPLFLLALAGSYRSATRLPKLQGIQTDEGQEVAFDGGAYRGRELAKKLPLDEPWPSGQEMAKALQRFGLAANPPKTPTMPSQILGDVYLIGQSQISNLTYMIDCGPEGVAIIDPTVDSEFERTLAGVEACGRSRKDIRWVINTHCHTDHAMVDHKFHEMGAQILIHEADAEAIEKGTRITGFARYNLAEFPRCPVDRRLSDGEVLKLGNKTFEVIHTPGHTPGSASFLLEVEGKNLLFSGDTVFFDDMLGWQLNPYADNQKYLASARKLEHFTLNVDPVRWDMLLPGHGSICLDKAYLDVKKCRERIERDLAAGKELLTPRFTPEYRQRMFGRAATLMAQ
jgi:glyoxylase-like metal-dependent hydrolase (beta-lactamase superfamily II)